MNFIAHAVVAGSPAPFAFGAMVPDLTKMVRGAPLGIDSDELVAGIRSHHTVDHAFHDHPTFKAWMRVVRDELGGSRIAFAAAHVGVELAMDGVLLERAQTAAFDGAMAWAQDALAGPWREIAERAPEVVDAYRTPAGVARRTAGAISRRPRLSRLALDEHDLARAIAVVVPGIESGLDALLGERGVVPAENRDAIRQSFADQAPAFEDPRRGFGDEDVMAWMSANTPAEPGDVVLEVAAGTALFGRSIAPRVGAVLAIDLTPEMLAEGKRAVDSAGIANVVFQLGDATALPFLDSSFDRVISRLAIHHFEDPREPLREMARVCRDGGTVTVIDMVVVEAESEALFNDLERRRDPAHTRALTRSALRAAVEVAGLRITSDATWENVLDAERWLQQTGTSQDDAEHVRAAWRAELDGGPATGMSPRARGDAIEFVHHWDLIVAAPDTRPEASR